MRLMEWCYVVCSHERLRGRRPAAPLPEVVEGEEIFLPLGDPNGEAATEPATA